MGRTRTPLVFQRGRYYAADLRPWRAGRPTLRNPKAPGWPRSGDKTEFQDVAEEWAREYVKDLLDDKHREQTGRAPKAQRVGVQVEGYLKHRARTVETATYRNNRTALWHLEEMVGASRPTDRVTTKELQKWFDARTDQGYNPDTLHRYLQTFSAFFEWLEGPNPAKKVELPESERRDVRTWSDDEIEEIRKVAEKLGTEYLRFFDMAISTGGRFGELMALAWEDFNPVSHTVRFVRQAVAEGVRRTKGPKGDAARTAIVLPWYWQHHRPELRGRIVHVQRPMTKILKAAGMKEVGVLNHTARHTYARLCVEGGVELGVLKKYLGHKSIMTTERYYDHMRETYAVSVGQRAFYGT